jgi:hypothetical protein
MFSAICQQFSKFIHHGRDTNQLLLHVLLQLVRDAQRFLAARGLLDDRTEVLIELEEFTAKVR